MKPLPAEEAFRWLTDRGGKWRKVNLSDGAVIIASIGGVEAYGDAEDGSEASIRAGLTAAINELLRYDLTHVAVGTYRPRQSRPAMGGRVNDAEVSRALIKEIDAMTDFNRWMLGNQADPVRWQEVREAVHRVTAAHRRILAAHLAWTRTGAKGEVIAACDALVVLVAELID